MLKRLAVLLLLSWPATALADAADTGTDAVAAIQSEIGDLSALADLIESNLQEGPEIYVVGDPLSWKDVITVPKADIDRFVGYLQVQNQLNPSQIDKQIALAAQAVFLPKFVVDAILKDRDAVMRPGGAVAAHAAMQVLDASSRKALKAGLKEIYKQVGALETAAAAIESGATEWPTVIFGGGGGKVNRFTPPLVDGIPMDVCLQFGFDCDRSADEWCIQHGFKYAQSAESQPMRPTKTLVSKQICDEAICNGFISITCQ